MDYSKSSLLLLFTIAAVISVEASSVPIFKLVDEYEAQFKEQIAEFREKARHYPVVWTNEIQVRFDESGHNESEAAIEADEFDFIVVGAGASGAVIASRLSEEPRWRVLLLEAGGPETDVTQIPAMHPHLLASSCSWGYTTIPQNTSCLGMEDHSCRFARGKSIGGDTAVNDMLYTRGHSKDYDTWADTGLKGWCWESLYPYFKKIENAYLENMDKKFRHYGGPIHIENVRYSSPISQCAVEACKENGIDIIDYNGKNRLGFGLPQVIAKSGKRNSVAEAYLESEHARHNLVIRPNSQVVKLVISEHTKEANAVKYHHEGKLHIAKAAKEIIVAAGAINTPHLLLLSGIGPAGHLKHMGIEIVSDLKVGHSFLDQTSFVGLNFISNTKLPPIDLTEYLRFGEGPLSSTGLELVGFIKTKKSKDRTPYPDVQLLIKRTDDSSDCQHLRSLNLKQEHLGHICEPSEHTKFNIEVILLHPKSYGWLQLQDHDPLHQPQINPKALSDEDDEDIETLLEGIRAALKLTESESFKKYGVTLVPVKLAECGDGKLDDEYWKCAIRHLSYNKGHVTGTAKMGVETDVEAVVDKDLRVFGVHKLRVADASVIPLTLSGNTMAAEIVIGEKAAEIIKTDWSQ